MNVGGKTTTTPLVVGVLCTYSLLARGHRYIFYAVLTLLISCEGRFFPQLDSRWDEANPYSSCSPRLYFFFFLVCRFCVMTEDGAPILRRRRRDVGETAVSRHMGELGGPSAQPFRHLLFFPRCHG